MSFLVIGAVALDRLLTISHYPAPDAKIRSTDYNEVCGGNAANSAVAIARLANASCWKPGTKVVVKILTKIGSDAVGQIITNEMQDSNVDTTSPLYVIGPPGSTTSVATILVDVGHNTRTCIFTRGSCGEMTEEDLKSLDYEVIFENVVHLHSDSRHSEVALELALEAKKRGIPISLDCEKDRNKPSLDTLLQISDMVFTNSDCLDPYLKRFESDLIAATNRCALVEMNAAPLNDSLDGETVQACFKSSILSIFLSRWHPNPKRQCIVTHGSMGALHFLQVSTCIEPRNQENNLNDLEIKQENSIIHIQHKYTDSDENGTNVVVTNGYKVHQIGVVKDVQIVDTTGAGDAFIGAFLLAKYAGLGMDQPDAIPLAMEFATWVSAKKLEGVGAQSALPRGTDVDQQLGMDLEGMTETLHSLVGRQFNSKDDDQR